MYPSQAKGFTLVELLTVIAILAILTAIAFPSFQSSLRSNRVATASNELLASLALARSEAIRSSRNGSICTSVDGAVCGGGWNDGWLVWTDADGDGSVDAGEPVVRYTQARPKLAVVGSAATITFDSRGRPGGGAKTIGLKPSDYANPVRCVFIAPTGQARIEKVACP